jgi:hypothetical protein
MTRIACAALALSAAVTLTAMQASAQTPPATPQAGGAAELYHVHFVKAAPGKLTELIDAYVNAPAPDPQAGEPPVIFRHVEGDDWHLLVVAPLGADETLRAAPPPPDVQQFLTKTRPFRGQHTDTFAIGPAWSEARKTMLGESGGSAQPAAGASPIYVVTVFRALPGHRDQLQDVLRKLAAEEPAGAVTLQHMEGASWEFLMISRYDSWAAFGESQQKAKGQALVSPTSWRCRSTSPSITTRSPSA